MQTVKKEKKRSLRAILLILLIVAVILIGSTYAWFVSNNNVSISPMEVRIESVEGIQISVDAINWQPAIDKTALASVGTTTSSNPKAVNQLVDVMKPVSTIGAVDQTNGQMKMFLGNIITKIYQDVETGEKREYYALTATSQTDVNGDTGHYIAFDMFLKYDGANPTPIYALPGSGVTFADAASQAKKLEYATRIAFIKEGWVASTAENAATTVQAKNYVESDNSNCGIYIWEPNYDLHNTAGTTDAKGQYNITLTESTTAPIPYAGIKTTIDNANDVHYSDFGSGKKYWTATNGEGYPDFLSKVGITAQSKVNFDTGIQLFTINPGITKIRVYIWIEGQDVDCINEASGANIKCDLKFTSVI